MNSNNEHTYNDILVGEDCSNLDAFAEFSNSSNHFLGPLPISSETTWQALSYPYTRKSGSIRDLDWNYWKLYNKLGTFVSSVRNITHNLWPGVHETYWDGILSLSSDTCERSDTDRFNRGVRRTCKTLTGRELAAGIGIGTQTVCVTFSLCSCICRSGNNRVSRGY